MISQEQSLIDSNTSRDVNFMQRLVNVWRDENNNLISLKDFCNDLETITIGTAIAKYKILEYYMSRREYSGNESDLNISRDDSAEILVDLIGPEPVFELKDSKDAEEFEYKTLLTKELCKAIPYKCRNIFENSELADMYMYGCRQKYC